MDLTLGEEKQITTFAQAVQHVSGLAQARLPDTLHGNVQRATALVLGHHVWMDEDGRHGQVLSSDGTTWYVCNGHCTCMGVTHAPQGLCKHRLSLAIYRRAAELLTAWRGPHQPAAAEGMRLPPAPEGCPEALFSACLRGTVRGIDTQLTARGQTFAEFQRHFDAVHALFDAPTARPAAGTPAPLPDPGEPPTCLYHGPMKASTKAPGTFFCTKKLADGSYCPSRHPER